MSKRLTIEEVASQLPQDWKLISDTYENLESELIFECPLGHRVYSNWKKMRTKQECPYCKEKKTLSDNKIIPKKKGSFRVLGLDQATYVSGYSIFEDGKLLKYGTFETQLQSEIERDHAVKLWLYSMIQNWKPDYIGIEGIQFQQYAGVTTFETLARLQGIVMDTCFELGAKYEICPTNTWRAHCGVKGRARNDKKKSMQLIAKETYGVKITEDEADAIGIGKYVYDTKHKVGKIENWE